MAVKTIYTNPTTQSLLRRVLADINANFQFHVSQFDDLLPSSSTDNAIPRWDGAGGNALQDSGVTIDDSDNLSGVASITHTDTSKFIHGGTGSTDNRVLRADGTGGTKLQAGSTLINDNGVVEMDFQSGNNNLGVGQSVFAAYVSGNSNIGLGNQALSSFQSGNNNFSLGAASMSSFESGSGNTAVGTNAIGSLTSANRVTAIGEQAFSSKTGGNDDTAVGRSAGGSVTTGSGSVYVGRNAGQNASQKVDAVNCIVVGATAYATANNQAVLGNSNVTETWLRGNVAFQNANSSPNYQSMDQGIFIADAGTAPSGNPSNGTFLWSESDGLHLRDQSGNTGVIPLGASDETVYSISGQTTDGSATSLSPAIPIGDDTCLALEARISAMRDDGTEGAAYLLLAGIRKDGASSATTIVVGPPSFTAEDDTAWNVTFAVVGGNTVAVRVTGAASKTINWTATVRVTKASA